MNLSTENTTEIKFLKLNYKIINKLTSNFLKFFLLITKGNSNYLSNNSYLKE